MKDKQLVLNNVRIFAGCAAQLAPFYFPLGKPEDSTKCEVTLEKVGRIFKLYDHGIPKEEFGAVVKVFFLCLCLFTVTYFNSGINLIPDIIA